MNGNIRVGNLFGIPFYVNPSWFLVLGLVTLSYGNGLAAQFPSLAGGIPLLLGFATALLLFASVVAHELGHSFVALRQGIGVQSITLFLFGGLASLEKESETPAGAFWVAIAGPLVSFLLFGIATLAGASLQLAGPVGAIVSLLAYVNLTLGVFNLIPGLPLDGGNILKAAVWKMTGNPYKGVKFASRVGQGLGWVAIATGLLPLAISGSFGGIWNVLIGFFLLQNAGRSAQYARVQEQFAGLTAADAVTPNGPIVSGQIALREFADKLILSRDNWRQFLVVDGEGKLLGAIAVDALQSIPTERWSSLRVSELAQPVEASKTIDSDLPLMEVVKQLEENKLSTLTVIRENGILVGLLEKASILNLVQRRVQASPA
ncbi:site-2 protease family protein [Altericista sp. CCNU0014]|uniref:site-2 protease family protein n=1 Tax=Altericista sp. CCNU0014 TaxID=3082949 RepID=UPI00384C9CF6